MTLHARLTELLEGHVLARVDRRAWWCSCRADCTDTEGSFGEHLASVLLSADGVAVVDLSVVSEPDPVFGRSRWRCRLADVNLHDGGVIDVEDSGGTGDHINARALAATLLVAADVAEGK